MEASVPWAPVSSLQLRGRGRFHKGQVQTAGPGPSAEFRAVRRRCAVVVNANRKRSRCLFLKKQHCPSPAPHSSLHAAASTDCM